MSIPGTFTRSQIATALGALGLEVDPEGVVSVTVSGTQVDLELAVPEDDGGYVHMLGEIATVVVSVPIDEEAAA